MHCDEYLVVVAGTAIIVEITAIIVESLPLS